MIMRTVMDQPKTKQEEVVDYLKAVGTTVTKNTIDNTLLRLGRKCCGQVKSKSSSVASTQPSIFGGREMQSMNKEHHPHSQGGNITLWGCFSILLLSARTLKLGHGWIFHQIDPKTYPQGNKKQMHVNFLRALNKSKE
uniref:Transposase Tc1-like domain-containing protein n=1 Tax=Oreochromis aureus TaxID=47969 RepID=A0AAZ1XZD0_OREAU